VVKPTQAPNDGKGPEKKEESSSARPVDGAANAKKFKDSWAKHKSTDSTGRVSVPGSNRSVDLTKVETDNEKVSIWTSSNPSGAPDFVIVNPPTEVYNAAGNLIEDPLTAIALIIDGATK